MPRKCAILHETSRLSKGQEQRPTELLGDRGTPDSRLRRATSLSLIKMPLYHLSKMSMWQKRHVNLCWISLAGRTDIYSEKPTAIETSLRDDSKRREWHNATASTSDGHQALDICFHGNLDAALGLSAVFVVPVMLAIPLLATQKYVFHDHSLLSC
nr:hypothetical protein CFP56_54483 [Quercus suber]